MKTVLILFCLSPMFLVAQPLPTSVSFEEVLKLGTRTPDAIVRYGEDELQYGELWLPRDSGTGLVVFIHGGCWRSEYSVSHSRALASRLADTGRAVWSLEYRRLGDPGGGFPGTFEDIELAATSLPLLHSHNIDTEKVLVAGHSAGGQLALWIAARFPEQFTGVIGLAAVTDLARYAEGENPCQRSARELMGGMPDVLPQRYQQYSPSGMQRHPNTHLIHGNNDRIVLPEQQTAMGLPDERLHRTPGAHFDLIHPATRDFKIVEKVMAGMLQ